MPIEGYSLELNTQIKGVTNSFTIKQNGQFKPMRLMPILSCINMAYSIDLHNLDH